MSKFTYSQRDLIKSLVATLSLQRIPDYEIVKEIEKHTNETVTTRYIISIREQLKKESYEWYTKLRSSQYSYIHEFRSRIAEIMELQKIHHTIVNSDSEPTTVKQASLNELHRLSITLSNLFDIAPSIINNGITLSKPAEDKAVSTEESEQSIIV